MGSNPIGSATHPYLCQPRRHFSVLSRFPGVVSGGTITRLGNLTYADVYFGRAETILRRSKKIKKQTIQKRRLLHQQNAT